MSDAFFRAQIATKSIFIRGSNPDPAGWAYDAPRHPSWLGGDTPSQTSPLCAFGASSPNIQSWIPTPFQNFWIRHCLWVSLFWKGTFRLLLEFFMRYCPQLYSRDIGYHPTIMKWKRGMKKGQGFDPTLVSNRPSILYDVVIMAPPYDSEAFCTEVRIDDDVTQGHVTSSVTWPNYSAYAISYRCPIATNSLSRAVFEIMGLIDIGVTTLTFQGHVT